MGRGVKITEAGEVALEYIHKYGQQLSKRAIADMLYKERPDLYKDSESARTKIRHHTGSGGKRSRKHSDNDRLFFSHHPEPAIGEMFYDISAENAKLLILSDVHVPFHDKKALDIAVNYGISHCADTIILNGDIFDHYTESTHEKDLGKRDPEYDYEQYQDFLFELRCAFPEAKIIFKLGNHENRYIKWFIRNGMGKMLNIQHWQYENIMRFDEHKIQMIDHYVTITCASLNIIHGHEYKGGGGINPARWLSLRAGESTTCGHFHRSSEHNIKTHRGDIQTYWSAGCLSQLNPLYMPYNNWNHGFQFVIKEGEMFYMKNKRIYGNQIL